MPHSSGSNSTPGRQVAGRLKYCVLALAYSLGLLACPEDGSSTFLRTASELTYYMASHSTQWYTVDLTLQFITVPYTVTDFGDGLRAVGIL
jgi:hypothetical protein